MTQMLHSSGQVYGFNILSMNILLKLYMYTQLMYSMLMQTSNVYHIKANDVLITHYVDIWCCQIFTISLSPSFSRSMYQIKNLSVGFVGHPRFLHYPSPSFMNSPLFKVNSASFINKVDGTGLNYLGDKVNMWLAKRPMHCILYTFCSLYYRILCSMVCRLTVCIECTNYVCEINPQKVLVSQ